MTTLEFLEQIFQVCIIPLLGILTTYAIQLIRTKVNEIEAKSDNELANKYLTLLSNTVIDCVLATQQTYVENLKKTGAFTKEAQEHAFEMTKNAVLQVLGDDAKEYLASIYGDLNIYIGNLIEAEVNRNKE